MDSVNTTSSEPITNAFFMKSPRVPESSAPLAEPLFGVLRLALEPHLEIQARPLEGAGVPHCADPLSLLHVVTFANDDVGDMRVQRVVLVVVIQNDQIPVAFEPSGVDDVAGEHGRDVAPLAGLDVDTVAERPCAEPGMNLSAKAADDTAVRGPGQAAAEAAESDGRRGFGSGLAGGRDLGQPTLLGLEVADERLQPAGRVRELADHPLVVCTLVADLCEKHASLGGVGIDLGLFTLRIGSKTREITLPGLFPTATVFEPVRRSTILLNEAGVQRGQATEIPDGRGAGGRVVAGQQQRQRPALNVDLVHRAQPAREGALLPGALDLQLVDLTAQRLQLTASALHARVEPRDLPLLLGKPLLDDLDLGEHRGLFRAGFLGFPPLLAQLAPGLLQLALLGGDRVVRLPGLARRQRRQGHRHGERRRPRAQRETAAAHGSRRPRASQPPKPPSTVPATRSITTLSGRRKVRRSTPSASCTSGSSRGPTSVYTPIRSQIAIMAPMSPCSMPCRSSGSRTTSSGAPTSRMISISWRRWWRTSVVAVVTVRMAATARTAPMPRPIRSSRRRPCARRSIHSLPPPTSSASGSAARRAMS